MRSLRLLIACAVLACGAANHLYAAAIPACLENALPLETLGNDSESVLLLAKACMREGKPLRAAALLSQIIKSNPTDAGAYINRGDAQAKCWGVRAGHQRLQRSDTPRSRSSQSMVRPRHCVRSYGTLRKRHR